jgi:hypothetical protein
MVNHALRIPQPEPNNWTMQSYEKEFEVKMGLKNKDNIILKVIKQVDIV